MVSKMFKTYGVSMMKVIVLYGTFKNSKLLSMMGKKYYNNRFKE